MDFFLFALAALGVAMMVASVEMYISHKLLQSNSTMYAHDRSFLADLAHVRVIVLTIACVYTTLGVLYYATGYADHGFSLIAQIIK